MSLKICGRRITRSQFYCLIADNKTLLLILHLNSVFSVEVKNGIVFLEYPSLFTIHFSDGKKKVLRIFCFESSSLLFPRRSLRVQFTSWNTFDSVFFLFHKACEDLGYYSIYYSVGENVCQEEEKGKEHLIIILINLIYFLFILLKGDFSYFGEIKSFSLR